MFNKRGYLAVSQIFILIIGIISISYNIGFVSGNEGELVRGGKKI